MKKLFLQPPSKPSRKIRRSLFDKCFRDKEGYIVLIQVPSPLLIIWLFSVGLQHVIKTRFIQSSLVLISVASLAWWSYLEITSGVNYFRRAIGLIVMLVLILGIIMTKFAKLF